MKENKNEKNNMLSNNYQDYKYEYTGYKDYLNSHKLNKEDIENDIKKEKEAINHDHNYAFDFNNPNEHQHDYSFDFNNPNEHQHNYSFDFSQQPKPPQPISQNRDYSFKTNPTYNNLTNLNNRNIDTFLADALKLVAFLFIIAIFVSSILFITSMNNELNNEEVQEDYQKSIEEIVTNYCNAIKQNDYTPIKKYIPNGNDDNIVHWQEIISSDHIQGNRIACGKLRTDSIESYTKIINSHYGYLFNNEKRFYKPYYIKVEELVDDSYYNSIKLIVGKAGNNWYLIDRIY